MANIAETAACDRALTDKEMRIIALRDAMAVWELSPDSRIQLLAQRPLLDHITYVLGLDRQCGSFNEHLNSPDDELQRQAIGEQLGDTLTDLAMQDNQAAVNIVGLLAPKELQNAADLCYDAKVCAHAGKKNQAAQLQARLNRIVGDALSEYCESKAR